MAGREAQDGTGADAIPSETDPDNPAEAQASSPVSVPGAAPGKTLSPAAKRALEEAEARRRSAGEIELPPEKGGRKGPEPTRFGDWEKKGVISDF